MRGAPEGSEQRLHKRVESERESTAGMASAFVEDVRRELERAAAEGLDLPARVRTMHTRPGHATPEYRTLAIPVAVASPEALSSAIAAFSRQKPPCCIILAFEAVGAGEDGESTPLLIAELRDRWGTRRFFMQPFRVEGVKIGWGEPVEGGWRDPGEEEMILDASFEDVPGARDAATALATSRAGA
jgi:hypothetical protein